MVKGPSAALAAAIEKNKPSVSADKMDRLRDKVREARGLEFEIADLTARLEEKQSKLLTIQTQELPDIMDQAGTDKFGLPAEGNLPAYDVELKPFYQANISAKWDDTKREDAFEYLDKIGHGSLIKTDVTVAVPRGAFKVAMDLVAKLEKDRKLKKLGVVPSVKKNVHNGTLTAWLKEQVEDHQFFPDLTKIGGFVGRVAKPKERKSR